MKFLAIFVLFSLLSSVSQGRSREAWGYTQFPFLKGKQVEFLPGKVYLNKQRLRPLLPLAGPTHPHWGVEQVYANYDLSKKIAIKKNVRLTHSWPIGSWVYLGDSYVFHKKMRGQVVAVFTYGLSKQERLKLPRKLFDTKKSKKRRPTALINVFIPCAQAMEVTSERGRKKTTGGNSQASIKGGESLVGCAARASLTEVGEGVKSTAKAIGGAAKAVVSLQKKAASGLIAGAKAVINDPIGAGKAAAKFAGNAVIEGAKAASSAVTAGAKVVGKGIGAVGSVILNPIETAKNIGAAINKTRQAAALIAQEVNKFLLGLPEEEKKLLACKVLGVIGAEAIAGIALALATAGTGTGVAIARAVLAVQRAFSKFKSIAEGIQLIYKAEGFTKKEKAAFARDLINGKINKKHIETVIASRAQSAAGQGRVAKAGVKQEAPTAPGQQKSAASAAAGGSAATNSSRAISSQGGRVAAGRESSKVVAKKSKGSSGKKVGREEKIFASRKRNRLARNTKIAKRRKDPEFKATAKKAETSVGKPLNAKQKDAVYRAHISGTNELGKDGTIGRVGNFTRRQIAEKNRILKTAGFSRQERRKLFKGKVVGFSPPVEAVLAGVPKGSVIRVASKKAGAPADKGVFKGFVKGDDGLRRIRIETSTGETVDLLGKKLDPGSLRVNPIANPKIQASTEARNLFKGLPTEQLEGIGTLVSNVPVRGVNGVRSAKVATSNSFRSSKVKSFQKPLDKALPEGKYTFIVKDDGSLVVGKLSDRLEVGVKHGNLAGNSRVSTAGELSVGKDGSYVFNNLSGTFAVPIAKKVGSGVLASKTKRALRNYLGPNVRHTERSLFDDLPPGNLKKYCLDSVFHSLNESLCGN